MSSVTRTTTRTPLIKRNRKSGTRKFIIPLILILIVAGAGVGYTYWNKTYNVSPTATGPDYKTATVRRGSIVISAAGTGKLVASQQQLSFSASGNVASLKVQVGDKVTAGQVLAQLDNLPTLQANINSAQQDLTSAQQALDTLKQSAASNLANAQIAVVNDQKAITDAQSGLIQPGMARCDAKTTAAYYDTYLRLYNQLTKLGDGGGNQEYYLNTLLPQQKVVNQAYQAYLTCAGFTQYEIASSQANLSLAQAKLQQDQATLDLLQKNNGLNPSDLSAAQDKITTAQTSIDNAKLALDGATIKAPYDGTIITVAGAVGDAAGSSPFITIADLGHPQVSFNVDETDMEKVALNEPVEVTFDAVSGRSFTGKVIQINPTLQTVSGYQTLQGLAQLDLSNEKDLPNLPVGLTASVNVVQSSAQNVLTVPVAAVRDLGSGQYGVFVLQNGQPRLKIVQVGLMDLTNAEIKQGLNQGDVVTTGTSQAGANGQ